MPETHKTKRGPLVSSRMILTQAELERKGVLPWKMFANAAYDVTHDLMQKVGYENRINIVIEPLGAGHPEAPGYMVVAKMRRK